MNEPTNAPPWFFVRDQNKGNILKEIIDCNGNTVATVKDGVIYIDESNFDYMMEAINRYPTVVAENNESYTGKEVGAFITAFINENPKINKQVGWDLLKAWVTKISGDR